MITPEDRQRSIELFKSMEEGHLDAGIAAAEKFVKEQGVKKNEFAESKEPHYPKNHEPGMRVPKGGSSCATCKYFGAGNTCKNKYFIDYYGSNKLPYPANEFCSDWYEPRTGVLG